MSSALVSAIGVRSAEKREFHLSIWHPLVFILLLPVVMLLLPLIFVACLVGRVSFAGALGALCGVLAALRGTHVEIVTTQYSVSIDIA
jgi:hypothetical protein